jgi:hypothetical protein
VPASSAIIKAVVTEHFSFTTSPQSPAPSTPASHTSIEWSTAVEGNDHSEGGVGTSILAWPKTPVKFPATLRIFYTADLLANPQPTFESSTGQKVDVADRSTTKNGLTFTIRKGEIDKNNPLRIRVYSTTEMRFVTVACLSCK